MSLAVLDLDQELYRLFKLLIAIAQPVLLVGLCVCFAIACIHLLTMLGTRWGHRRVSSKAMLFSLALHLSLATGIVALIPEYRHRIWARLTDDDELVTIRIEPTIAFDESHGPGAAGPSVLRQLPRPMDVAFTRVDRLPDPFTDLAPAVDKPETVASQLPDIPLATPEPPTVEATPERIAAASELLQEFAAATLDEPVQPAEVRPEEPLTPSEFERPERPAMEAEEPETPELPAKGALERIAETPVPASDPESLALTPADVAPLRRDDDDSVASRTAPSPAPSSDPATDAIPAPSPVTAEPVPGITRSGPLRPETPREMTAEPADRPRTTPAPATDGLVDSTMKGPTTPDVTSQPSLARADAASDARLPATYQLRAPDLQKQAVEQFGGSAESEAAVERSLQFLAAAQEPNGRWNVGRWEGGLITRSPDGERRDFSAADLDVGVTALATLAFLGKQNTLDQGPYAENVRRAVRYLVSQQHSNGFIGFEPRGRNGTVPGNMAGMYGHAMASFALGEAYAMSRDWPEARTMRRPIERAVAFILASQLEDGGWRYFQYQTQGGDMSIFGWQAMALKSAELGGIPIPRKVRDRMVGFLKLSASGDEGGLAAYRPSQRVTPSMTAEAFFCRQILGVSRNAASSREAVAFLLSKENIPSRQRMDLYYWYYGTLAMMQFGGSEWDEWNTRVRDLLIAEQVREGDEAGSWNPRDPWSGYGGRIYSTAMATLCLEVYYRYMPLYKEAVESPAPAEPGGE